jgi:hypothetical protein
MAFRSGVRELLVMQGNAEFDAKQGSTIYPTCSWPTFLMRERRFAMRILVDCRQTSKG